MNDQLKYMIAGATIAIVSGIAGGTLVGWTTSKDIGGRTKGEMGQPSAFSSQLSGVSRQPAQSGHR